MSTISKSREAAWIVAAVLGLFALFFMVLYFKGAREPGHELASRAQRLKLVNFLRSTVADASEAQNSAVLAATEQEAKAFVDQAASATLNLQRGVAELTTVLTARGDARETEMMARVDQTVHEFQQIDKQLLDLATRNSNRKAFALAFGPARKLIREIDQALAQLARDHASPAPEADVQISRLADEVQIAVLQIQIVLPPHIAEEDDKKMDDIEAEVAELRHHIHDNLAKLQELATAVDKSALATATSRLKELETVQTEIIKLSRQNTDLKAAKIAVQEKRKAMLACQDALAALERAIQSEQITAIPAGR